MTRIVSPRRPARATRRGDLSDLREVLKDGRIWCQYGVVSRPDVSSSHWERTPEGDIMVHVETMPRGLELYCRLGAAAGAVGMGAWRVPAVGTEVAVVVPDGEVSFQPMIVAILSSGGAPARVSDQRTVVVATDAIEVDAPAIRLGGEQATQAAIKGDAYATAEDNFLAAQTNFLTAISVYAGAIAAIADPSGTATTTLGTAITAFAAAINSFRSAIPSSKSTVVKIR